MKRPNKRLKLTAPLGATRARMEAAPSRSPVGERRRRGLSAVFDGPEGASHGLSKPQTSLC